MVNNLWLNRRNGRPVHSTGREEALTQLNTEVEMLRRIPLFSRIEPSKLKLLAFTSEHVTYQDGQILMRQGEIGAEAFVLLEGRVAVTIDSPEGEVTVAELGNNEILGEIAILCDVPRTASVKALGEVKTLRIRKEQFLQLIAQFPQMGIEIMRSLADRLSVTTMELADARRNQGAA
jgi:CRP-like cAMP-binding protein